MDKTRFELIQSAMNMAVTNKEVAGCNCLLYKNGKEIGYWQSGYADLENKISFNRNTICRLYSMTKPVTAVAVLILVERGLLDLNQWASDYYPEFCELKVCKGKEVVKASQPLLIKDLLNMTSGYSYGGDSNESEKLISGLLHGKLSPTIEKENNISTQDIVKELASYPVSFEPGTDYQYGLSADILAGIVEKISGLKFSDFLKKNIFIPLGMNDTDFYVPEEKQSRLAKVYAKKNDDLELYTYCNLGISNNMKLKPLYESGGAGLCSTIDDYMKFCQMLVNKGKYKGKQILQPRTVEYLTQSKLNNNLQKCFDMKMPHLAGYTYRNLCRVCLNKSEANIYTENGEFGWDGWLGPYMLVDIVNDITIVYMQQRTDCGTTPLTRKIQNIIYSTLTDN